MDDLSRSSNLEDPLNACSGLSLFPRTLKSLSIPLPRLYQSDDRHQTHTLLESMSFQNQKEHLEEAKAILDDSSELLKEGIGTSEDPKMNPVPNKRERRPGLDRKRGHFTLKPMTSQPPQSEPTFDGSKYPRPDDYFAAYERFENAQRQWQKYKGTYVPDTQQNQPSRRPRRQGLPGRERGSFKLTFTENYLKDAIHLEALEKENPIPSEQNLERTTAAHVTTADGEVDDSTVDMAAHVSTADREVDDSTVDTDKNLDNILNGLLACNPEELEGDKGFKLLEERLQIKPIEIRKLSLPEFQDVRKMKLKASVSSSSNRRHALLDIQNVLKGINTVAARKTSQSPSSNPSEDQFSFSDSDDLLPGDKQPTEVHLAKDSNTCNISLVTNDADQVISNASPSIVGTLHVTDPIKSSVQKSSCGDGSDAHSGIHRSHSSPDGNEDNCVDDSNTNKNSATVEVNVDIQTKGNEGDVSMSESEASRDTGRRENDADINAETDQLDILAEDASIEVAQKDPFTIEEDSTPYQQGESSKSPNKATEQDNTMDGFFEHAEQIQEQPGEENDNRDTASGLQVENAQEEVHNSSHEKTKKRKSRESCDESRETVCDESEGDKQMKTLPHEGGAKKKTKTTSNEREEKKQKKTVTRESKIFSRRKSLAGAGTKWETGCRRSTRIKSRPLEYWKGERFLYGRVHESLATVIGIKYESPGQKKGEMKVKSFVSEDYKKLIDLAALH